MILSSALISPVSQLQIEQVMTSQIRSHIEHLDLLYSCARFIVKIDAKCSLNDGF